MRQGSYPGSDIVIEQELDPGANYRRYYASYLSEGLKIYALLTVPDGEMPPGGWPVIVFNHGFIPPDVYRTTERYIAYVDTLARHGYIVFRIDYRGHDQSEGEAQGAYSNPGYTVDVLNAVASIKRFPLANPEKVGMWGHSMGGYLTLRAMVISPDIKAGVIWAGVVGSYPEMLYNWRGGIRETPTPTPAPGSSLGSSPGPSQVSSSGSPAASRRWRTDWIATFGTPEQNPEFWDSVSATSFVPDLSGPLQLHHGTADESVPLEFSIRLAERVRAAGGTADLYIYDGDNHNISNYFSTAMARTVAFFDEHLK
jgi:dipeptidyl aminopeptidase/acylaminoacyl peptidase